MLYANPLLEKTFNLIRSIFLKIVTEGSSGSKRVTPNKARADEVERTLATIRTILFDSGHLQHERERLDMERKYMNSDKVQ